MYNHGEISWGPDDPDKRFLYLTRVDDNNFYRLDLQRQIIAVLASNKGVLWNKGRVMAVHCIHCICTLPLGCRTVALWVMCPGTIPLPITNSFAASSE